MGVSLLFIDRRRGSKSKGRLNLFGQFLDEVCMRLEISREQAAREAGIDSSTLHYNASADKDHKPKRETVQKLVNALRKHDKWLDTYKVGLFNAADLATDEQIAEIERMLVYMRYIDEHPLEQE